MNWKQDINQLVKELPELHHNFFHTVSKTEFYTAAEKLILAEKDLDAYAMVVELSKLIALAGDAHTSLEIPRNNRMPFDCYWFEEGIFITETTPELVNLLHHKIVEIDGVPISEIIQEITDVIPHENMQFVKAGLPALLVCTDFLYGSGIVFRVEKVELTLESLDGAMVKVTLPAVKAGDWDKMEKRENLEKRGDEIPYFRKNRHLNYWMEKIGDGKILYVKYNKCREQDDLPIEKFIDELKRSLVTDREIKGIILDYRNNTGGNSELFRPFIEWLSDFQNSRVENLEIPLNIFVVVGRDTFSSALLNVFLLKFKTKAVFVGEATGGKPNCYGEVNYFKLEQSGLSVRYSTRYYYLIEDYQIDSFYPDENFEVRIKDYVENRDPCVDWIKQEVEKNE